MCHIFVSPRRGKSASNGVCGRGEEVDTGTGAGVEWGRDSAVGIRVGGASYAGWDGEE